MLEKKNDLGEYTFDIIYISIILQLQLLNVISIAINQRFWLRLHNPAVF